MRLIQSVDDLPNLKGAKYLYLDLETTSGDHDKMSVNPWKTCKVAGVCIAVDDSPAYYVPVAHHGKHQTRINVDRSAVIAWLRDIIDTAEYWVNHNIKYDAHVLFNDFEIDTLDMLPVVCTLALAKLVDSDRQYKGGYSLATLSKAWLAEGERKRADLLSSWQKESKDYGFYPIDLMCEYGCYDVIANRSLFKYIQANLPSESKDLANIEIGFTSVLIDIERVGLRVDPTELKGMEQLLLQTILEYDTKIASILGRSINPIANKELFEVLVGQYGLPVLGYTEGSKTKKPEPSFSIPVLQKYLAHPYAPHELIKAIIAYRHYQQNLVLFIRPWQEHQVDGRIHATYNQSVRTGRLSCSGPNMQQCNAFAKQFVLADSDSAIMSCDFSQIEFRTIVHYIDDKPCIAAYNLNPDTDFHQWVADEVGIARKPAKTINFMLGYGGGRKRTIATLSRETELVSRLGDAIDDLVVKGKIKENQRSDVFMLLCQKKANDVYDTYHKALPTLSTISKLAENRCTLRGYVKNHYGRRRYLPPHQAYRAFNALNQSTAADLGKDCTLKLWRQLRKYVPEVRLAALVHDDDVLLGPKQAIYDDDVRHDIIKVLEDPTRPLKVPLRCSAGRSTVNWSKCYSKEETIEIGDFRIFR